MKIINSQPRQKCFYDLEKGTVFQGGGKIFMKTEYINADDFVYNAVELETGKLVTIFDSAVVTLLNCSLVIE